MEAELDFRLRLIPRECRAVLVNKKAVMTNRCIHRIILFKHWIDVSYLNVAILYSTLT